MESVSGPACILCKKNDGKVIKIKKIAIGNLIKHSKARNDKRYGSFEKLEEAYVHESCKSSYGNMKVIDNAAKKAKHKIAEGMKISSEAKKIDFKLNCFLCGEIADHRMEFREVRHDDTGIKIKNALREKDSSDPNIKAISARLKDVEKLTEVSARYHVNCFNRFYNEPTHSSPGRPLSKETVDFCDHCIKYMEENGHECQFSFNEMKATFSGKIPDLTTVRRKLKEHFKGDLDYFPTTRDTIIIHKNNSGSKLSSEWYEKKSKDLDQERIRIVEMASNIILEDIRSQVYDKKNYEILNSSDNDLCKDVPETLKLMLDIIIKTHKKIDIKNKKWDRRVATYAHCLISSARPRSFLSPILLGLSAMSHKNFASRNLIESFAYLGLCGSYDETIRFEKSIVCDRTSHSLSPEAYLQFVFDNADHNTCTIDGKNTFHAMGGIQIVTPGSSVITKNKIPRLEKIPSADEIGKFGYIPYKTFNRKNTEGLNKIEIENIFSADNIHSFELSTPDFLWFFSQFSNDKSLGWNGFMEKVHFKSKYTTSKVIPMPFLNKPASDPNTIFSIVSKVVDDHKNNPNQI